MQSSARAHANIALVKYWGKSDPVLNVPAVGSLSVTLDKLWSDTQVEFSPALRHDSLVLDGKQDAAQLARVSGCLDLLRERAGTHDRAAVVSRNNFPTGAGLASSASGFAALVCAAARALELELSPTELSILARRGSGSAARSIFGGYVEMHAGAAADGSDSYAEAVLQAADWPLTVVIAVTTREPKATARPKGCKPRPRRRRTTRHGSSRALWISVRPGRLFAVETFRGWPRSPSTAVSSCMRWRCRAAPD